MRKLFNKNTPPVKPVNHVEVDDKHRKLKLILIVLLLAVGITLITVAIVDFLTVEPGWETIQADVKAGESSADDFVLLYYLGAGDQAANLEKRALTALYTEAATDAFRIFHESQQFDGLQNLAYLNSHPNEAVQLPEALYNALALLQRYENRDLFLAPIYQEYVGLFSSATDTAASMYDPDKSPEQAQYFAQLLAFTGDDEAIRLELLDNNTAKLSIREDYLQFAQANGITVFADLYWMKNAFIADYLAQRLAAEGYTSGSLSSFDGYSRNLDSSAQTYRLNILDRVEQNIYMAATLEYTGAHAFVSLRNYPTSELAVQQYYQWADGSFLSCHIDSDGRSRTACNDLIGYSSTLGCAEILMQMRDVYIADALDADALTVLSENGVQTIYCKDRTVYTSDSAAVIRDLFAKDNILYTRHK